MAYSCLLLFPIPALLLYPPLPSSSPLCAPPLSFCCLLPIFLSLSRLVPTPIILLIISYVLYSFVHIPSFFPPLFPFTRIFPYLFCANTHYLVLLFPPLFFTLDPVVFASPSLSSNQINWCETIHFHNFLWSLERRLWSDLNLYVREGI